MTIRSITIRGEITEAELHRIVSLIRDIDVVPGRLLSVNIDGDGTPIDAALTIMRRILEPRPDRVTADTTYMPLDRKMTSAELLIASSGLCPDCDRPPTYLTPGPQGGMNQNFACSRCGAEFNIAKHGGVTVWGERLSEPGKPNVERLRSTYGITL